jgi:Flp pilus assembly protein TadD/transglutaminase-like putative cysteine protease
VLIAMVLPLAAAGQPSPDGPDVPSEPAPPEGARVESVELVDRIEADGTMFRRQRNRVRAIDAAGVAALSQVAVPFLEAHQKAELTRLTLIKPDGRELDLLPSAPRDVAPVYPPNLPIYSDLRVLRAAVPSIEIGDRLDWETTVAVTPLAPGEAWTEAVFADADQADLQVYELDVAESLAVRVHVRSDFEAVATEESSGGRLIRRWRLEGRLPSSADAAGSFVEEGWAPHVSASTFDSWNEFGRWWAALAPPQVDDAVRAKAAELVAGAEDRRAKLARLHRYVAQEIRYLTLPLGLGRYRAREPGEVIRTGLGDCKDKIRLLASLAAAVGIEVDPVLVGVERRRRVDDAPSPFSFDHVVARVRLGDDSIWMDPTSEMTAMGALPAGVRDLPGVALVGASESAKAETVTTPERPPIESSQRVDTVATIEPGGTIRAKVRWTFSGDDEHWRLSFRYAMPEERRKLVDGIASDWGKTRKLGEVTFGDPIDLASPFWFEYEVEFPMTAKIWAKAWDLWLPVPNLGLDPVPDAAQDPVAAKRDLHFSSAMRRLLTVRVELPEGVRATPPVPVTSLRDFAEYRSDYRVEGRTLSFERELVYLVPKIPPARFADLDALREIVADDRRQEFAIAAAPELVPTEADDAASLGNRCVDAIDEARYAEAEALCRRAVELDPEHRHAWNNLGRALFRLERFDEAEAAYRRQLEIAPDDEWSWSNLGLIAKQRGNTSEAERLMRRQIEVTPLGAPGHRQLAYLLAGLGRREEAETFYARALKLDPDDEWTRENLLETRALLGRCAEVTATLVEDGSVPADFEDRSAIAHALLDHDCQPLAPLSAWFERLGTDAEERLTQAELPGLTAEHFRTLGVLAAAWRAAGSIALERGDAAEADRWLEAALHLSPSPDAAVRRALALDALGHGDEADRHYAIAAAFGGPQQAEMRERFAREVPDAIVRGRLEAAANEATWKLHSLSVTVAAAAGNQGKLRLLFGADGRLIAATRVDDLLPSALVDAVLAARPALPVAPGNRARIPRQAQVHCSAAGVCLVLFEWPFQTATESGSANR